MGTHFPIFLKPILKKVAKKATMLLEMAKMVRKRHS